MKILALLLTAFCVTAADWKEGATHRWKELPQFNGKTAGFKLLTPSETGVSFTNFVSEIAMARNRIVENGSGVAVGDFDGDGRPDIFACAIESPSRLFRNVGGFKFQDQTAAANLPNDFQNVRGAVFADINGDAQLDLLISTVTDGVRSFVNSAGRFTETTAQAGLRRPSGSTTLALADVDGNGTLDLYVTNYRTNDIRDVGRLTFKSVSGKPFIPPDQRTRFLIRGGDIAEYGEADQLYLNDGKGVFRPVPWTGGAFLDAEGKPLAQAPLDWGLTATFRDVNNDGAPDLYVCNDYWTPDRFWINDGKGRFRAAAPFALRKIPSSSMGVDFGDINRDGVLDFFVVDMLASDVRTRKRQMLADKPEWPLIGINAAVPQVFHNTLYLGREDGTYAEAAHFAGLEATDWSWSPIFFDVDLDGFEDVLITAGHFRDVQDLDAQREIRSRQHSWAGYTNEVARQKAYTQELMEHYRLYPLLQLPLRAYRNGGDVRFREMTGDWGLTNLAVRHGMALGDFDADGDLDVVANCLNSSLEIFRNESAAPRVAVRLKAPTPNVNGIGAKIVLRGGTGAQQKELFAGGSYISGSEPLAVFALAPTSEASIEITWPGRKTTKIDQIIANRLYEISQSTEAAFAPKPPVAKKPLFEDVSGRIAHSHHETPFDDYQRQPTLPFKLSQVGPGVAWFDVNSDGADDLIIGSGGGQGAAVFHSDGKGNFTMAPKPPDRSSAADLLGVLGWKRETNSAALLAAASGYESPQKTPLTLLDQTNRAAVALPTNITSASVLALGCFAPPSGLALFVGGTAEPARYPIASASALLRLEAGEWKHDARNSALLSHVGLVNGAVWSDLNADGASELVLACEWGPIRVFAIRSALLTEITAELGLSGATGLWKGIATADVNNDGRMDIIAANWGLNTSWRATAERPFTAYYGVIAQPGRVEFIETAWDSDSKSPTALRPLERLYTAMPFLIEQFHTAKDFANAPIAPMLGERAILAKQLSAKTLASTLFLNRGGKFTATELPIEAQLVPAISINPADFNGDGNIDIFISQNFMAMHADYSRADAGRGLLLKGDGRGSFKALSGSESGVKIYGEQRAAAVCDFDGDGRMDLAVTQNGAETKLYRNVTAEPGLRVRLQGPAGNRSAMGAQFWIESDRGNSAVYEIQSGSGYLAQDSPIKTLPRHYGARLIVRWPGGAISTNPIPEDSSPELLIAVPTASR